METTKENVLDYCSDITLHNNHVLVCIEGTVGTLQLTTLSAEKQNANSNIVDNFFKDLAKNPKTIVKASNKAYIEYPELFFGDMILFNMYGNPTAIFIENDPCELDNVIKNFKFDSKDRKFTTTLSSVDYKVRCYYTFEASSIILTKKL